MSGFWYYAALMERRRRQNLQLLGVRLADCDGCCANVAAAPEPPPRIDVTSTTTTTAKMTLPPTPAVSFELIPDHPCLEQRTMRNEGPSSLAWMLIMLLMMGSVGLTVIIFLTLMATNLLVPGITGGGGGGVIAVP